MIHEIYLLGGSVVLLMVPCYLAGSWFVHRGGGVARFGPATQALAGALLLAAVLSNLAAAGLSHEHVLVVRWALIIGAVPWSIWMRSRHVDKTSLMGLHASSLCVMAVFGLVLWVPLMLAASGPPVRYDAVAIWWPKLREVAAGLAPVLENGPGHLHAEYPRGLAWLITGMADELRSFGDLTGASGADLLRRTSWLFTWLGAAALYEAGRSRGNSLGGFLAGLLLALLPATALWAHSGYADPAIAGAVLLAGLGLTLRRQGQGGRGLAVVAALGAASIKQEGAVLVVVVAGLLLVDSVRCKHVRFTALAGLAAFALLLPWALRRGAEDAEVLGSLGEVLLDPMRLTERVVAVARAVGLFLTDRGALVEDAFHPPVFWAGWVLGAGLLVLLPRGRSEIDARPALVLLAAIVAIYVVTPFDLHWHLRTAFPRLLLQALPLVLLAAVHRITAPAARVEASSEVP